MSNNLLEQAKNLLAGNQGQAATAASTQKAAPQNNQNRKRPAENKTKQNGAKKADIKNLGKTKDKNTYNPDASVKFGNDTNPLHTVKKSADEPETLVIKVPFPNEKGCAIQV